MVKNNTFACRVCGNIQIVAPWSENGKSPTHDICGCCGVEFGYEDSCLEAIKAFRLRWLAQGAKWWIQKEKPENWNLEEQMKNILEEYR